MTAQAKPGDAGRMVRACVMLVAGLAIACGDNIRVEPAPEPDAPSGVASVQILSFNDFHGAVDVSESRRGAAQFAAQVTALRTPDTLLIAAGDLIGGSPLTSGLFHDEPTIEAMNLIGLDALGVGNHEFDEGPEELIRIKQGGCHPVDGCLSMRPYLGARFPVLAANVFEKSGGERLFPPYVIRRVAGVNIAIVGMTLEDTPGSTVPSRVASLEFRDEVETMTALLPELQALGVRVIVLALHEGGSNSGGRNECEGVGGPIKEIAEAMDPAVALIASGHSHNTYICRFGDRLVTSAGDDGRFLTRTVLEIDRATQTVVSAVSENIPVDGALAPDPEVAALVAEFDALAAPLGDRVIGTIAGNLTTTSASGERSMGDVITDAMRGQALGSDVALMNSGGIRGVLEFAKSGPELIDGEVRFTEAFTVQPFSNRLSTFDVTGAELVAVLDAASASVLFQISGGTYKWSSSAALGSRVLAADVTVGGVPVVETDTYRIVTNEIVIDRFPTRTNVVEAGIDLDILLAHFAANSPLAPPALDRILALP